MTGLPFLSLSAATALAPSALRLIAPSICSNSKDLRREPIEKRKELLAELLSGSQVSLVFNESFDDDGRLVFDAACQLGCEGIVSKRLGSPYRSGRSPQWVKVKNPKAPAVKREAEEDWGERRPARASIKVRRTHVETS
jgi:hypothetical protein